MTSEMFRESKKKAESRHLDKKTIYNRKFNIWCFHICNLAIDNR